MAREDVKRARPDDPEHREQAALIRWAEAVRITRRSALTGELYTAALARWLHAIPNGAKLAGTPRQRQFAATRLKREGMEPGAADLVLLLPSHPWPFATIEMKPAGSKPRTYADEPLANWRPNQRAFAANVGHVGGVAVCCYGWIPAAHFICDYLGLEDSRP